MKGLLKIRQLNWRFLVSVTLGFFYIGLFIILSIDPSTPMHYGGDFLAFWSTGKIADTLGYHQIYNLDILREIQFTELHNAGFNQQISGYDTIALPAPYLPFFIIPFQFISRFELMTSFWIWQIFNTLLLLGYLYYFFHNKEIFFKDWKMFTFFISILLFSFPVFDNIANGQVNILLMISLAEYIRNSLNHKPFIAGIWLAGLLFKPQLLIIIVPIIIFKRYWKALSGFSIAAFLVLIISFLFSGYEGLINLVSLWTKWGENNAITGPKAMINWRMVGDSINHITRNAYISWVGVVIGMILTLLIIVVIVKNLQINNKKEWTLGMMGVIAGTLVLTWHSHQHMALVLIPLLLLNSINGSLPQKYVIGWSILPTLIWIFSSTVESLTTAVFSLTNPHFSEMSLALSGFLINLLILIWVYRFVRQNKPELAT